VEQQEFTLAPLCVARELEPVDCQIRDALNFNLTAKKVLQRFLLSFHDEAIGFLNAL
jgi:hypothetical protein